MVFSVKGRQTLEIILKARIFIFLELEYLKEYLGFNSQINYKYLSLNNILK